MARMKPVRTRPCALPPDRYQILAVVEGVWLAVRSSQGEAIGRAIAASRARTPDAGRRLSQACTAAASIVATAGVPARLRTWATGEVARLILYGDGHPVTTIEPVPGAPWGEAALDRLASSLGLLEPRLPPALDAPPLAGLPTRLARRFFEDWSRRVTAALAEAERPYRVHGRRTPDRRLVRAGFWLTQVRGGLATVQTLAATYHTTSGPHHEKKHGPPPCDGCTRTVRRALARARALLATPPA
jgi:hypothetical protein